MGGRLGLSYLKRAIMARFFMEMERKFQRESERSQALFIC